MLSLIKVNNDIIISLLFLAVKSIKNLQSHLILFLQSYNKTIRVFLVKKRLKCAANVSLFQGRPLNKYKIHYIELFVKIAIAVGFLPSE